MSSTPSRRARGSRAPPPMVWPQVVGQFRAKRYDQTIHRAAIQPASRPHERMFDGLRKAGMPEE